MKQMQKPNSSRRTMTEYLLHMEKVILFYDKPGIQCGDTAASYWLLLFILSENGWKTKGKDEHITEL